MDFDLRIVLILLGLVILGVIVWDAYRKKKVASEKSMEFNRDTLDEMMDARDFSGFDITGVGTSRTILSDEDLIDEPMVAIRDDAVSIVDEAISDTDNEQNVDIVSGSSQQSQSLTEEPELIVNLNILAKNDKIFDADKLLHCMLSRGLRFGEMNIFHRHKNTSGEGTVQFSLANAVKPGTFDLDDMTSFQTKGLSLFMILPGPKKPMKAYQIMLDTAQHLATELNGQLLDASRNSLTQQSIQLLSDKVQEFERRNSTYKT